MIQEVGWPASAPDVIRTQLVAAGVEVRSYRVDLRTFAHYLAKAPYPDTYRQILGPLFPEKALEHWVSLELLGALAAESIDVASCTSPFADIVQSRTSVPVYRQDLTYLPGVHGFTVGGSADALPFPDGFFGAITLHCSFEHFEGEADTGLIVEAARVLRPGGRLCILPLYLADRFANTTDPTVDHTGLAWDQGAVVHGVEGWNNRFGRFYNIERLCGRVLTPAKHNFRVAIYDVENARDVDPNCYLKLALLLERR